MAKTPDILDLFLSGKSQNFEKRYIYGNLADDNNYYLLLLVGLFKVSALATVM